MIVKIKEGKYDLLFFEKKSKQKKLSEKGCIGCLD